jgi:hypothetical protein
LSTNHFVFSAAAIAHSGGNTGTASTAEKTKWLVLKLSQKDSQTGQLLKTLRIQFVCMSKLILFTTVKKCLTSKTLRVLESTLEMERFCHGLASRGSEIRYSGFTLKLTQLEDFTLSSVVII